MTSDNKGLLLFIILMASWINLEDYVCSEHLIADCVANEAHCTVEFAKKLLLKDKVTNCIGSDNSSSIKYK